MERGLYFLEELWLIISDSGYHNRYCHKESLENMLFVIHPNERGKVNISLSYEDIILGEILINDEKNKNVEDGC